MILFRKLCKVWSHFSYINYVFLIFEKSTYQMREISNVFVYCACLIFFWHNLKIWSCCPEISVFIMPNLMFLLLFLYFLQNKLYSLSFLFSSFYCWNQKHHEKRNFNKFKNPPKMGETLYGPKFGHFEKSNDRPKIIIFSLIFDMIFMPCAVDPNIWNIWNFLQLVGIFLKN